MPTRRGSSTSSKKEPTPIRNTVSGLGGAGHPHAAKNTGAPKVSKKRS